MLALLRYLLLILRRDYIFISVSLALIVALGVASFLGDLSISEAKSMQVVFSVTAAKMVLSFGTIIMICFFIRRFYENREIDIFLSYPISKINLILAFYMCFAITLLCLILVPFVGILIFYHEIVNPLGYVFYFISLFCELLLLSAVCIFFALLIQSVVVCIFLSATVYILSKSMGFIISIINLNSFVDGLITSDKISEAAALTVSLFFPRLDLFANSQWVLYGVPEISSNVAIVIMQTLAYLGLILFSTIYDFNKKSVGTL